MQNYSSCRTSSASFAHILESLWSINCHQISLPTPGICYLWPHCSMYHSLHLQHTAEIRLGPSVLWKEAEEWLRYTIEVKKYSMGMFWLKKSYFLYFPPSISFHANISAPLTFKNLHFCLTPPPLRVRSIFPSSPMLRL